MFPASLSILLPTIRRPRLASIFGACFVLSWYVAEPVFGLVGIVLNRFVPGTTRPNPDLPPELLDHVVDFLRDSKHALRNCCLVSKSWVPRTRKHLFADISFHGRKTLESWRKTFLDPSTSPTCHTKTLSIHSTQVRAGGWVRGFSHVVHFDVDTQPTYAGELMTSLLLFHRFSPTLKSLRVNFVSLPPHGSSTSQFHSLFSRT